MGCEFPEHHGSGGGPGILLPLGVTVAAVALGAGIITSIIHILAMVITFVGIATLAVAGGWLWWRVTHRLLPPGREQIMPQRRPAGHQLPYQQQPGALEQGGGMHLHLHGEDAVAEYMRRQGP